MHARKILPATLTTFLLFLSAAGLRASEADIKIPRLDTVTFDGLGGIGGYTLMYFGIFMCIIGAGFGLFQYWQTRSLPVHESMADVSNGIGPRIFQIGVGKPEQSGIALLILAYQRSSLPAPPLDHQFHTVNLRREVDIRSGRGEASQTERGLQLIGPGIGGGCGRSQVRL